MSSKKVCPDNIPYKQLGDELLLYRGGYTQEEFASILGISGAAYGNYERGARQVPVSVLREAQAKRWGATNNGPGDGERIYNKDRKAQTVGTDSRTYNGPSALKFDSEVILMARDVLSSNTGFARSLELNIRSFHQALQAARRMDDLEARMGRIEGDRMEKEARIRAGDPIEQKDEFLRKREGPLP